MTNLTACRFYCLQLLISGFLTNFNNTTTTTTTPSSLWTNKQGASALNRTAIVTKHIELNKLQFPTPKFVDVVTRTQLFINESNKREEQLLSTCCPSMGLSIHHQCVAE